jgi:hypothetical protein
MPGPNAAQIGAIVAEPSHDIDGFRQGLREPGRGDTVELDMRGGRSWLTITWRRAKTFGA